MNTIIVASARNTLHSLNRVVSLLRGGNFNVEAIVSMRSERPDLARLAIVVDDTHTRPARVAACLDKIEDVWAATPMAFRSVVQRELALVKSTEAVFPRQSAAVDAALVRVVSQADGVTVFEITGHPEEVARAIAALPPESIIEVARLGPLVMATGPAPTTPPAPPA